MKVIKDIKAMQEISDYYRRIGKSIGFVPTMGFLHEGHVALMLKARDNNDIVVSSIFVNPTQFLPNEDLKIYPRDFLRDYYICKSSGIDYIFYPASDKMYPEKYFSYLNIEKISERLEGKYRPGHFKGVATVCLKLFNIIKPHRAYFGQKDAQQSAIIRKMISDLNMNIEINICETVREPNGLAKSSRNSYLSEEEKSEAVVLNRVLQKAKEKVTENKFNKTKELKKYMREFIETNSPNSSLQYIAVTDNDNLNKIKKLNDYKGDVLISLAVFYGKTRLIDNILFEK